MMIRSVIQELTVGNVLPSGARLRAELADRFGSRGGVARMYRILAEERRRREPPPDPQSVAVLQEEAQAQRKRAELAVFRERSHQTRWAAEVDRLRLKVAELEPLAEQTQMVNTTNILLRHQLQAAERRITHLEQQVFAGYEAAGSTPPETGR
jgi:hypothetical protein